MAIALSLKKVCAWCETTLLDGDGPITHGIYNRCAAEQLGERGRELGVFLESFGAPVAVVDSAGRIVTANSLSIRSSVMRAFASGRSEERIPAVLNHVSGRKKGMTISTEPRGGVVFLRVDGP